MQELFSKKFLLENMPYNDGMIKVCEFGSRLAALRRQNGLTQAEFAERLGITREMVNYYEHRAYNPTGDFLQKAATALGVTTDELLGVTPIKPKPGPKSKLRQQFEQVEHLSRKEQQFISKVLDQMITSKA